MNRDRSLYLVVGLAVGLVVLYFYKIDRGYSWRHSSLEPLNRPKPNDGVFHPAAAPWIEGTCIVCPIRK